MKRYLIIFVLILFTSNSFAQKDGDSIIILHLKDTSNIFNRAKWSMVHLDFIVKDLPMRDTLKTYPREFLNNNYMIVTAIIKDSTIRFSGIWGSRKMNLFGFAGNSNDFKSIIYYKGSVEWKIMKRIAEDIGGVLEFKEIKN